MTRRLLTPILVPLFLAACGVAVEQSSLPQTSAPDIIPETETAAAPQPAQPGDADADGATGADEAVDVASLAPSVTGSIDGLIEMIETEAEAKEKAAEDTAAQPPAQTGVAGSEAVAEDEASVVSDETQAVAEVAPDQATPDEESAAAAAGIEITGAPAAQVEAMRVYGMELGMAFQIMDDALDYTASAEQMGKNAGDDFADQKITLPTILAWQDGDAEERAFWQRTLGEADFAEGDLERAQALLASHDAVNRSVAVAHDHAVKAGAALAHFIGDERTAPLARALADAALFAAHRAS